MAPTDDSVSDRYHGELARMLSVAKPLSTLMQFRYPDGFRRSHRRWP